MSRHKSLVLAALAVGVLLAVLFASSERENPDLVAELARKQQAGQSAVPLSGTASDHLPDQFQLTGSLIAKQNPDNGHWAVHQPGSSSYVVLPFPPNRQATAVDATEPTIVRPGDLADEATQQGPSEEAAIGSPVGNAAGFLGAAVCAECHREKHDGFVQTSHHRTSGEVTPATVPNLFHPPANQLPTSDPQLTVTMIQQGQRFLQNVALHQWETQLPMDVVTGSGKIGQTYLYWHGNELYQNFVSYLHSLNQWIPSPGYPETDANFARHIRLACLECHITYIDQIRAPNVYHRESAIWGISCERCHGPGQQHVQYHREHPKEMVGRHITAPADLPRQRQLDICGQCHSGMFALRQEAFAFRPGMDLSEYHKPLQEETDEVGGIHTSNQLTRLKKSVCFEKSEMTCTTCHNPHQFQRGDLAVFTAACLKCHDSQHCGLADQLGPRISENCISCHMPTSENEDMANAVGGGFSISVSDHHIRIDPEATKRYLQELADKGAE